MSNPIKQHIIPEFYLKYFTDAQGYLAVYDSEQDKFFDPQKPCNTGYKNMHIQSKLLTIQKTTT